MSYYTLATTPQWATDLRIQVDGVYHVLPSVLPLVLGGVVAVTTVGAYTIKLGRVVFPKLFASQKDEVLEEILTDIANTSRSYLSKKDLMSKVKDTHSIAKLVLSTNPKEVLERGANINNLVEDVDFNPLELR